MIYPLTASSGGVPVYCLNSLCLTDRYDRHGEGIGHGRQLDLANRLGWFFFTAKIDP